MKIAVIGQGYVGLNVSMGAASAGHKVIGFEVSENLTEQLLKGETFVPGIDLKKMGKLLKNGAYLPTTKPELIDGVDAVIIAVPTPLNDERMPDMSFVKAACLNIAKNLTNKALIVNESTSYPGTLRNFIKKLIETNSSIDFWYASAPERIDPGNQKWTLANTPRVISGLTNEATQKAVEIYKSFCSEVYEVSSPEVAEASKLFENTFRQINIALANEFAIISDGIGFSANEAISAASTKPFGFMPFFPSIGVGGHCIPVDPSYLSYAAQLAGGQAKFIDLANSTNLSMARYIVGRVQKFLGGSLKGKSIQVAGIAYKPDVPDMRESPSLLLLDELESQGAEVSWSDPVVIEYNGVKSMELNPNVDLGLLVVPHKSFDFSVWKKAGTRVLDLSANPTGYGWSKFF
jgi:UDP-N-acetyl-D-glucosamine dehydrogenase